MHITDLSLTTQNNEPSVESKTPGEKNPGDMVNATQQATNSMQTGTFPIDNLISDMSQPLDFPVHITENRHWPEL